LISAVISVERIVDNSDSASRPWTAFKSCESSIVYSAFNALVFAVTETLSIENAIWLKCPSEVIAEPSPNFSPSAVEPGPPVAYVEPDSSNALAAITAPANGSVPACDVASSPECTVSASLKNASVPVCDV
jgi:hypothetical protein